MRGYRRIELAALAGLCLCASTVWANVYVSGVSLDASQLNGTCGVLKVDYVLNENANGDGTRPGVKFEVLDNTSTVVRTVSIPTQTKGPHSWEWDGRKDDGTPAANGTYTVKITAADYGHTSWTQIAPSSTAGNATTNPGAAPFAFYYPRSVAVNKRQGSPHYGKIYVSEGQGGPTGFGRTTADGVYALTADGRFVHEGHAVDPTGTMTDWTHDGTNRSAPYKLSVGPDDDRIYVTSYFDDLAFEMPADLANTTQLITSTNRFTGQYVNSVYATGSQTAGNRYLYAVNSNYNDTTRKGVLRYNLGANAKATGTPEQYVARSVYSYYPWDIDRDPTGNWYVNTYRSTAGQAPAIQKFTGSPATLPITASMWDASNQYTSPSGVGFGRDEFAQAGWPQNIIAYGRETTGYVFFFNADTGAFVGSFQFESGGTRHIQDVAFDDAGNLYTVCNQTEWLRVWSPPDGPNYKAFTTGTFSLNKSNPNGPTITTPPADVAACAGASAGFTVAATGTGTLTYQWLLNGVNLVNGTNADGVTIAGATTSALSLTNVPSSYGGSLVSVLVCDDTGVVISPPAVLAIGIYFIQPPASQTKCQNTDVTFTVNATGTGTLSYQWQKDTAGDGNFVDIAGATSTSVTDTAVTTAMNGTQYRVTVSNAACGSVNSPAAVLTVKGNPVISHVGYGGAVPIGGSHTMSCYVSGTGLLHYQWKKDGVPIAGATSATYTITNAACGVHNGLYSCMVTDDCGSAEGSTSYGGGSATVTVGRAEVCTGAFDDDCDGLIDCEDPDCSLSADCVVPCNDPFADADDDDDVDMEDFGIFQACFTGAAGTGFDKDNCHCFDRASNQNVDELDYIAFANCASEPEVAADIHCDDYPSGDVVINEIQYDEWSATADVADNREFVELYNKNDASVDISGWLLRTLTMSGRNVLIPGAPMSGTVVIPAHGFFVIGGGGVPANITVSPSTDFWENGLNGTAQASESFELVDANGIVKDTVVVNRSYGAVATLTAPEGGIWGPFISTATTMQSLARWVDGVDTGSNGRDFGVRAATPNASNNATVVTAYVPPNVNSAAVGSDVTGLTGSFINAKVINPADITTLVGADELNPNVIPASPQGGNAIIAWDPSGGGNTIVSNDIMTGDASFDLWVYFDTSNITIAGAETTVYGLMGTADPLLYTPDPGGTLLVSTTPTASGCTGLAWVFQKDNAGSVRRLFLVDAGPGGNSTPDVTPVDWVVHQNIDMSTVTSGWYRLSIAYTSATGAVVAKFGTQTFNFNTAPSLKGGFYIGYRESLAATPATLRPPTFDSVAP